MQHMPWNTETRRPVNGMLATCNQVADIADVVRQRADALMLSGESAVGAYPEKALAVLRQVSTRIEEWCRRAPSHTRALSVPGSKGLLLPRMHGLVHGCAPVGIQRGFSTSEALTFLW